MRAFFASLAISVFSFAFAASPTGSDSGTRMLRSPTVNGTQIAFAYANNIWVVDRKGGLARRLTSFQGETGNPHFSPDGTLIAFSGEYGGNTDVYVIPAAGGEPKRLTWHPAADLVEGWTPDGKSILFSSTRATAAPTAAPRFWTVPAEGGIPEPLPLPRGYQGKISPDGTHIAYRMNNSWDEERRNYRGGQNRPIWIVNLKSFDLISPPWEGSKDMEPAWMGNAVYFISDRDGVANIWSFDTQNKKLAQVTKFTGFDVKTLDTDHDGAVVFEQAGYIHELDAKNGKEHIVPITAVGDFPWMMPRWEDVTRRMTNVSLSPTGKRVLMEARGEIFTVPAEKGDVRNLTNSSGSAERDPAWSPDGKHIAYFSDKSGEYGLMIATTDGLTPPHEIKMNSPKHYYTVSWSPDSKKLVYTDTDLKVWVVDVASGQQKVVGNDPWMVPQRTLNPTWSPDSKWVAYSSRLRSLYHAIFVANVETGQCKQVTDGLSDAVWPVWDASGKYLWFLASTDFGLKSQWLDMTSYEHEEDFALYLTVLKKGDPSPLLPESDEDKGISAAPPSPPVTPIGEQSQDEQDATPRPQRGQNGTDRVNRAPVTVQIDFDGIEHRMIAVQGIPEKQYTHLAAGASGTVFFLETPADRSTGGDPTAPPRGDVLHRYRLSDRKAAVFVPSAITYAVSADGHKLVYEAAVVGPTATQERAATGPGAGFTPALFLVDADKVPPQPATGRLNFALKMYLDPKQEFRQIFNEGWRNQRDYLYVKNMHGSDWPAMKEAYGQLLPYVNHRADLNYLVDMMGSEIAIGHSFVRGGDIPNVPTSPAGLLGADFTIDQGRYKVTHIYNDENWNPDLKAPLAVPGVDVSEGDYIVGVNGVELRAPDNIYRLLDGTANHQTVLAVNSRPVLEGARQVTVVPVANEQALRTRAWVEENRRKVDKLSGGKLAYVYLPNTGQPGYTSFNRYYFAQQDKQGAIIDERFNGGGSAADYIIDVLQRNFDGYFNNVAGDRYPFTSPAAGIWGPKVMIINEMSGSGGDLMPWMFHHRHIGELVGKRTWGGLVHTADTPVFIDGGSMIAPRGGFFNDQGQWDVENKGTTPDIEVENWPKDMIAGHDPQLERAVAEAMKELQAKPVHRLTAEPPAPTWGQRKVPLTPQN
ncbi:MAG TPA: PDZ domain-containing protein [Bryobacteraceae bacterium]|jgi:tricorn protease|nr:PDZ domain-containing protein [Bryobacteraceae bacterium]